MSEMIYQLQNNPLEPGRGRERVVCVMGSTDETRVGMSQ